jgi:hypothetical protein
MLELAHQIWDPHSPNRIIAIEGSIEWIIMVEYPMTVAFIFPLLVSNKSPSYSVEASSSLFVMTPNPHAKLNFSFPLRSRMIPPVPSSPGLSFEALLKNKMCFFFSEI